MSPSKMTVAPAKSSSVRVQATNDDCNLSKRSAAELGYYSDDFVKLFTGKSARRTPLINRGYFIRIYILRKMVVEVVRKLRQDGCQDLQVLSVGAGYDTTFFQLIKEDELSGLKVKYCEIDYPALIERKVAMLHHYSQFREVLKEKGYSMHVVAPSQDKDTEGDKKKEGCDGVGSNDDALSHDVVGSNSYTVLGQDLRKLKVLEQALQQKCGIDPRLPTLFISECVFNYIRPKSVHSLLRWIPRVFDDAIIFSYDQLHPEDGFGETMMHSLHQRGSPLLAIGDFPSCEAVKERYAQHLWCHSSAISMSDVFYMYLEEQKFVDIEERELFDEFEDWHIKCCHYAFSWALSSRRGRLADVISVLPEKRIQSREMRGATGSIGPAKYGLHIEEAEGTNHGDLPGRWGHAACLSQDDNKLLVFGGFGQGVQAHQRLNDVIVADVEVSEVIGIQRRYPKGVDKQQEKLFRRMYHSLAPIEGGFVSFGGRQGPNSAYNDIILVTGANEDELLFRCPDCKGQIPSKRWRHSMTRLGQSNLYLMFGGWDGSQALNDFYILEYSEGGFVWHEVKSNGDEIAPRFGHSLDLVASDEAGDGSGHHLLLHGGYNGRHRVYGETYSLQLSLREASGSVYQLEAELLSDQGPDPRYSHASFVKDDTLFIIGGITLSAGDTCCAFSFNWKDRMWNDVELSSGSNHDLRRHIWAREKAILLPDGKSVALVGGGILCFSFGSKSNPIITRLSLRSL